MKEFFFEVTARYTTAIEAETEEEAKEIANNQLQYIGEEIDTIFELRYFTDLDEEEED